MNRMAIRVYRLSEAVDAQIYAIDYMTFTIGEDKEYPAGPYIEGVIAVGDHNGDITLNGVRKLIDGILGYDLPVDNFSSNTLEEARQRLEYDFQEDEIEEVWGISEELETLRYWIPRIWSKDLERDAVTLLDVMPEQTTSPRKLVAPKLAGQVAVAINKIGELE